MSVVGWIISVDERPVAEVRGRQAIIYPEVAITLEPCLLAFKITTFIGDIAEGKLIKGFRAAPSGASLSDDDIANAIRICIAYTLSRKAVVEEERIFVVEVEEKKREETIEEGEGEVRLERGI